MMISLKIEYLMLHCNHLVVDTKRNFPFPIPSKSGFLPTSPTPPMHTVKKQCLSHREVYEELLDEDIIYVEKEVIFYG